MNWNVQNILNSDWQSGAVFLLPWENNSHDTDPKVSKACKLKSFRMEIDTTTSAFQLHDQARIIQHCLKLFVYLLFMCVSVCMHHLYNIQGDVHLIFFIIGYMYLIFVKLYIGLYKACFLQ